MIRRPPRSTRVRSSAASDVYKRQEERGLRGLEQHPLLRVERLVHEMHRVVDERRQARRELEVLLRQLARVGGQAVVDLGEHPVLLAQGQVELLAKDLGVEQI